MVNAVNTPVPVTLFKSVSENRDYLFDFSSAPEFSASVPPTFVSAAVVGGTGLSIAAPALLAVETEGVPAGQGWTVRISGGEKGVLYKLGLNATLSTGRVLTIQGRLQLIPDYY